MRALSDSELLDIWEFGQSKLPVEKALILLESACPESSIELLARLSIGERDSLLLTLRELTFGRSVTGIAVCPSCDERLELEFSTDEIRVRNETIPEKALSICFNGYEISFRLPNSLDLLDLKIDDDLNTDDCLLSPRRKLLERTILKISSKDEEIPMENLTIEMENAINKHMSELDRQADISIAVSCLSCGHKWEPVFDIISFFWNEINNWAFRTLREVHALALGYSWSEAEILAMSENRRQLYLEMLYAEMSE
jgi:T4 bacteriophage base plate protein